MKDDKENKERSKTMIKTLGICFIMLGCFKLYILYRDYWR